MYYKINVAKDGRHFFATSENSIHTESKLKEVVALFKQKFPEHEGYKISASLVQTIGKELDI